MKKTIFTLIIVSIYQLISAQISPIIPSSSSIAITSVADTHSWTSFNNPAMLGYLDESELGIQFENKFLISELSTKSIQFGYSNKLMNTSISFSHFGYSLYHEMLLGVGFARNFSNKFALGVQFNYDTAFFSAYNNYRGTLLPQVGFSAQLSPTFTIGFSTFNPFQSNIKTEFTLKRIPSIFSLGTEYYFIPEFAWRTQIDKELSSNYRFATGFEYSMLKNMSIKLGAYAYDYLIPCLGFGFNIGSLIVDLNCEMHPLLGLNSMAALKYRFGN